MSIDDIDVRPRIIALADALVRQGSIRSREWRQAFEGVPRHVFVPRFYQQGSDPDQWMLIDSADSAHREAWLDQVYSDDTLTTQLRSAPAPEESGGGQHVRSTSSSTAPGLMLAMLEDLDVRDDHCVLEIGTGTGYTAALLCARLGGANVASIDIHPEVVEQARSRLAALGHAPILTAGDGSGGLVEAAPYDRVIATCAVSALPQAWVDQTRPGGIIMADLRGGVAGALAKLHRRDDGTAQGRFLPYPGSFMWLRPHADHPLRDGEHPEFVLDATDTHETASHIDPSLLQNPDFAFLAQLHLPGVYRFPPSAGTVLLFRDEDTWAEASQVPDNQGAYPITYSGETNLWNAIEAAHQLWEHADRPTWERFGITVTPERQRIWLDDPDNDRTWDTPL